MLLNVKLGLGATSLCRVSRKCPPFFLQSVPPGRLQPAHWQCTFSANRRPSQLKAEPESKTSVQTPQDEEPVWVKREKERAAQSAAPSKDLPWPLLLLFSSFCAIAAVGSAFEWSNKNAIFGVIGSDNVLYTPILGFLALTGLPTAGFLFFKAIEGANKSFELEDRVDGYKD